jgi:hypothetical protein
MSIPPVRMSHVVCAHYHVDVCLSVCFVTPHVPRSAHQVIMAWVVVMVDCGDAYVVGDIRDATKSIVLDEPSYSRATEEEGCFDDHMKYEESGTVRGALSVTLAHHLAFCTLFVVTTQAPLSLASLCNWAGSTTVFGAVTCLCDLPQLLFLPTKRRTATVCFSSPAKIGGVACKNRCIQIATGCFVAIARPCHLHSQ